MSTRSNVLRLAVFGLLITRAPRSVQRVLGYMLMGVAIAVIWIVLGVTARGEPVHTERQIETALALNIFDATCRPISDTAKTAAWIILNRICTDDAQLGRRLQDDAMCEFSSPGRSSQADIRNAWCRSDTTCRPR